MGEGTGLKTIVEAALLAAGRPLDLEALQGLFEDAAQPDAAALRGALAELAQDYEGRGIELREVGTGWRIQVRASFAPWVSRLWEEKPGRYSRALMETLAIIAYRQPITRGEIEDIRGVAVSTNIVKTLLELCERRAQRGRVRLCAIIEQRRQGVELERPARREQDGLDDGL
jgi:segregation and condensation protein B